MLVNQCFIFTRYSNIGSDSWVEQIIQTSLACRTKWTH